MTGSCTKSISINYDCLSWKRRYLDKIYNRSLLDSSDKKKVNTEKLLITSSNSKMRQLQMKLLGNRFKTNKREYSFIKHIGKL